MGLNPLFAVLLKPFSPLLPEPFQYLGIEAVLACALQFFFSIRLFCLILGLNSLGILLCSAFFLVSPALVYRLNCHLAASNHWLLVASLLVDLQAHQKTPGTIRALSFRLSPLKLPRSPSTHILPPGPS